MNAALEESAGKIEKDEILIELYNQPCLEYLSTLESNSVDLVLIDPPYEISKQTGFTRKGGVERFSVSMDFGEWDKKFSGLERVIQDCYRVLRKGGTFVCFYDLWKLTPLKEQMELSKFKQIRFIEWVKTNPVPLNSSINYLTGAREIALVGVKGGNGTFNDKYHNGIYNYPISNGKKRFHPTQKPINLITELVEKHSNKGDLVLDCFSGSGTTALAAMKSGRRFKGCELDFDYHRKSIDRLNSENTNIRIKDK